MSKIKLTSEFATRADLTVLQRMMKVLPDPDEILAANNYDFKIYRDLLTDPHLQATIQQRKMQVLQMEWEINYEGDEKIKQLATDCLNMLPLSKVMSEILDCIFYGMTIQEITWMEKDGLIKPVNLEAKPQEWFIFTLDNELVMRRREGGLYLFEEGKSLPPFKFIINRWHPTYTNPYGEKIAQTVYWPITFKRAGTEFWQLMVERYGMPFLTGYYPTGYTSTQIDDFVDLLKDMITENVAAFEEVHKENISLLEQPSYDIGQLYQFLINHHNKEISKAVLTVTLTTDIQGTGSYKAGEIHKQMLEYIGLGDKKMVENSINKLLEFMTFINYGDIDSPKIFLKKKQAIIEESGERDGTLHDMGVRFTKDYYQRRYNLEADDFEIEVHPGDEVITGEKGTQQKKGTVSRQPNKQGLILVPSKTNPKVMRWQRPDKDEDEDEE